MSMIFIDNDDFGITNAEMEAFAKQARKECREDDKESRIQAYLDAVPNEVLIGEGGM